MFIKNFLLVFLLIASVTFSQTIVPISDLRNNDSNGVPVGVDQTFTVSGIVTASNQLGNSGPGFFQDATGGISIYASVFANSVKIGDSVVVTAKLTNYNGLAELTTSSSSDVKVISSNHNLKPEVVTLTDIKDQTWDSFEEYEGKLVRINNVTISGSGNFASGTNYILTDSSGTLTDGLRVDNDVTSLIGTPIPSGKVDIVGVVGQFVYGPPYNSGYQIQPRFIQDIIFDGSPTILTPILAADLDTTSFTVYFKTARNGNAAVKYGLTSSLDIDSIAVDEDTTSHSIKLTGLKPGTTYYYKVYSTNSAGTSVSDLQSVSTASANPQVGTINVYFNFPVDTSVAMPGNAAHGNVDFSQKLLQRINSAKYSIDMAVYSFFGMPDIANALVVAKNRGVKIRVVYDNRTMQNSMQTLVNAGIKISQRPASLSGIMHNKFLIFDARDTITTNDWLWTGSWNVTSTELGWKNNIVEINDPTITKAYQKEFEEMWGSNTDTPNSANAKFGSQKSDNTIHSFSIGGRSVYVYFSPSDGTTSQIIKAINTGDDDIYLAQYTITRNDIGTAIHDRYTAGVTDIKGVVNSINDIGSEYSYLSTFADMWQNPGATLHDKYGVIDATNGDSDPIVITGSHNWSSAAETSNDENTLFIHDTKIANLYMQDFKRRYNDAGGTGTFVIPTGVQDKTPITAFSYKLYQNYPNPFNPATTIRFEIPKAQHVELDIFDMLGRKVRTLYNNIAPSGVITVDFNAANLASGMYIYRLITDNLVISKKLMLLK